MDLFYILIKKNILSTDRNGLKMTKSFLYCLAQNGSHEFYIIHTKMSRTKLLYNKKQAKKENPIKTILCNKNFTLELIKDYEDIDKNYIKNEILFFTEHYKSIQEKVTELKKENTIVDLHFKTKNSNIEYGLKRENYNKETLEKVFQSILQHSMFEYSLFDFYNDKFLFELKSYNYSLFKYPTAIIGTNKGLCENSVFVFEFTEQNGFKNLYFIQYNYDIFHKFNQRYIKSPNRIGQVLCFDIPIKILTYIDKTKSYTLTHTNTEYEIEAFKDLIEKDKMNYNKFNM